MKKGLLIFSIITTVITVACTCYSTLFFALYVNGMKNSNGGTEVAGLFFFLIFNFFTLAAATLNLVPNIIHFVKCKKPVVIIFFVIAILLFIASITMLTFSIITVGAKS